MTRRERLEMVIRGEITEELIEDCKREIEKIDRDLAKLKENDHYNENKTIENRILQMIGPMPMQIDEIRTHVAPDLTRQRVTAICTNLVREGKIQVCEVKTKKGKRKAYYI